MQYDVASKVLISRCKDGILRRICGLAVRSSEVLDTAPQETASLRRSDFVLRAEFEGGRAGLVLVEFQTRWKPWLPVRTLESRCRHWLAERLPVTTVIILLRPHGKATDRYRDEEVDYRYRLVRLYEMDAREVLDSGPECLFPFIPLMKRGSELVDEAERAIYDSSGSRAFKSDLLTGMAILGGLVSRDISAKLIKRRRDIMIESAAYDIIRQEGYEEGMVAGMQKGIQEGIQKGIQEGMQEGMQKGTPETMQDSQEGVQEAREDANVVPSSTL